MPQTLEIRRSSASLWGGGTGARELPVCCVGTGGRSFHSWQATSHALQPMQVEVSMYL